MVQSQQALQEFGIGQCHRPTVCCKHRRVQLAMRLCQPAWSGVVEIGQGALLQFLCACVGRIEPCVPLRHKIAGGLCDGFHERCLLRLIARWPREREGFKGGSGSVAKTALRVPNLRSRRSRPHLMDSAVQNTKEVIVFTSENIHRVVWQNAVIEPNKGPIFPVPYRDNIARQIGRSRAHFGPRAAMKPPPLSRLQRFGRILGCAKF